MKKNKKSTHFFRFFFIAILSFYSFELYAQWGFSLGGDGLEYSSDMVCAANGNIYVCGNFQDNTIDFDPGVAQVLLNNAGGKDVFLACYSDEGILNWAISAGGSADETIYGIDIDALGNVYITGQFSSEEADFDPGSGTHIISRSIYGDNDYGMFLASYNPEGELRWAFAISPTKNSLGGGVVGYSVHADKNLNVWVTGTIWGKEVDFNPGNEEYILDGVVNWETFENKINAFIAKYSSDGEFLWAGAIGRETTDVSGQNITSDVEGNIYLCGYMLGAGIDFNPGAEVHELTSNGSVDAFIMKLENNGNFKWAYNFGGTGVDLASSVVVNNDTFLYVTGYYENSVDFDPTSGNSLQTSLGSKDVFISKYHTNGNYYKSVSIGSAGDDRALKSNIDNTGNLSITGSFSHANNDFDPGVETLTLPYSWGLDMFYGSLNSSLDLLWMRGISIQSHIKGIEMMPFKNGYLLLGEITGQNVDVDAGINAIEISSSTFNTVDLFLAYYQNPTLIDQLKLTDNKLFRVFPNPFTNNISMDLLQGNESDIVLKVFDLQGKIIFQSFGEINFLSDEINKEVNKWNNGTYLFSLEIDKINFTQKIIKSSD